MRYNECVRKGLLRRTKPDLEKASRSMEIARERLKEAEVSFRKGIYSGSLVLSYSAMFHAARALLFRDGWSEKSHACVVAYLREKYVNERKLEQKYVSMLDSCRAERHETLYGLETSVLDEDAERMVRKAREFVKRMEEIVGEGREKN